MKKCLKGLGCKKKLHLYRVQFFFIRVDIHLSLP